MEVSKEIQREYNPAHPNYKRWQKAREISNERAEFVEELIATEVIPEGLRILDIGSGEGSTSRLLSKKNFVVSLEIKSERIKKISRAESLQPIIADGLKSPFKPGSFDLIILQDVIEHLTVSEVLVKRLLHNLKENGIIYLSTPNRLSLFNIIADPHWGLPFLALFKRNQVKKYYLKFFRKNDFQRDDIAELLSLEKLYEMFNNNFELKLYTKFSVEYLLNGGKGLVWSSFHLWLIKLVNLLGLKRILFSIANDKPGIINKFFTPTFYIIFKKK
jgi:2-polyprenyl-3-methyl-5-hydroxy-6-metoxy-1,4-benzoquinol methylase